MNYRRLLTVCMLFVFTIGFIGGILEPRDATAETLGKKVAGTYLGFVNGVINHIVSLTADGYLSSLSKIQFSGGAARLAFSDQQGEWKKTGKRQITSTVVDFAYDRTTGVVAGPAVATYILDFDEDFQTGTLTVKGAVFPPNVNPLVPDAKPIPDTSFSATIDLKRVP